MGSHESVIFKLKDPGIRLMNSTNKKWFQSLQAVVRKFGDKLYHFVGSELLVVNVDAIERCENFSIIRDGNLYRLNTLPDASVVMDIPLDDAQNFRHFWPVNFVELNKQTVRSELIRIFNDSFDVTVQEIFIGHRKTKGQNIL